MEISISFSKTAKRIWTKEFTKAAEEKYKNRAMTLKITCPAHEECIF
ncbi:hypothetical protein ACE41H_10810 [Paenibacillus enshidis]|uniref:Uncharacterized protein n=1 Tax=Paenibacillus enshidis TaxID=1458439 RepID=A0ABV5ASU1_9BACL